MTPDEREKLCAALHVLQGMAVNYWDKTLCLHGSPVARMLGDNPRVANAIVDMVTVVRKVIERNYP